MKQITEPYLLKLEVEITINNTLAYTLSNNKTTVSLPIMQ